MGIRSRAGAMICEEKDRHITRSEPGLSMETTAMLTVPELGHLGRLRKKVWM